MPVIFHGPSGPEILRPAPKVNITKSFIRDSTNNIIRPDYTITLTGVIVNVGTNQDSPNAQTYGFGDMEDILQEQGRIRKLFSVDGGRLEIESPTSGPSTIDAYCTVESVTFSDNTYWTTRCDYTIVLKCPSILMDDDSYQQLSSYSESWNITEEPNKSFNITHNLSAVGSQIYTSSGVNNPIAVARDWCNSHKITVTGGVASPSGYFLSAYNPLSAASGTTNFWNYSVTEGIGVSQGSWELTESFVYFPSGNAREEYSIVINQSDSVLNKNIISVNGSVFGFADKNSDYESKLNNAVNYWNISVKPNIYTRILNRLPNGWNIFAYPQSRQDTYEESEGVFRYAYTYLATSGALITNAIEENISITDTAPTDVFAQIQVPGRSAGPVVQYMFTSSLPERTINISATIGTSSIPVTSGQLYAAYLSKPNTDDLVRALQPNRGNFYLNQDTEDWNVIRKQYSRNVSWVIQLEGQTKADGMQNVIKNPKTS